jgi:hypothetical protein
MERQMSFLAVHIGTVEEPLSMSIARVNLQTDATEKGPWRNNIHWNVRIWSMSVTILHLFTEPRGHWILSWNRGLQHTLTPDSFKNNLNTFTFHAYVAHVCFFQAFRLQFCRHLRGATI